MFLCFLFVVFWIRCHLYRLCSVYVMLFWWVSGDLWFCSLFIKTHLMRMSWHFPPHKNCSPVRFRVWFRVRIKVGGNFPRGNCPRALIRTICKNLKKYASRETVLGQFNKYNIRQLYLETLVLVFDCYCGEKKHLFQRKQQNGGWKNLSQDNLFTEK